VRERGEGGRAGEREGGREEGARVCARGNTTCWVGVSVTGSIDPLRIRHALHT